jgi:hypothetical protein
MLWYVQLSALLHAMYAESVLDAVELDLEREGVLYGSEAVQGNPGPSLDVNMVVEAPTSSEATASASALLVEALRNAGGEPGAYEFESCVLPMSEVERRLKAAREDIETPPPNSNSLTFRVLRSDGEDTPPGAPPRA